MPSLEIRPFSSGNSPQVLTPCHLVPVDLLFHPLVDSGAEDNCQNWNCVKREAAPPEHQAVLSPQRENEE